MKAKFERVRRAISVVTAAIIMAISVGVPSFAANAGEETVSNLTEMVCPKLSAQESGDVLGAPFIWPTNFEPGFLGLSVYLSPTSWDTETQNKGDGTYSIYYWPYGRAHSTSGVIYFTYDHNPCHYKGGTSAETDDVIYQQYAAGLASSATSFWYVGPVAVDAGEGKTIAGREYAYTLVVNGITYQCEVFAFLAEDYLYSYGFAEAGTMSTEMEVYINTLFLPYLGIVF